MFFIGPNFRLHFNKRIKNIVKFVTLIFKDPSIVLKMGSDHHVANFWRAVIKAKRGNINNYKVQNFSQIVMLII